MRSFITATQIDDFFNGRNRDAQELLPELIRRLVTATVSRDNLMDCHIPVHNEIGQPGLDGQIELRTAVYPLPAGKCFLEVGTDRTPKTKADGDYKKRIDAPKEEYKSGTFLFVTPHRWPEKDGWCSEKSKDAFFANTMVFDSTDLESWLGYCPAVTKWLLRQIGMVPTEFLNYDEFFRKEVLNKYNEKIVPKLLTEKFSRERGEEPIDAFINWLKSEEKNITVFAPSSEEAVLFIAGSFMLLPDEIKEYVQNRVLFIYDSSILSIIEKESDLILVVMDRRLLREIKSNDFPNIRCICPESKQINPNTITGRTLTLERMARDQVEAALKEMGYSAERAYPLANESHGSLTAVLWMISNAENTAPKWSEKDDLYELLPLLMLGQWNANSVYDKQIVEKISTKTYAEIEIIINKWSNERGGPLIQRGAYVDWLAWDYCWALLSSKITDTLFNNYFDVAADVLGTTDPVVDIPVDERWYSFERLPYSASLRKGICATAANISSANGTKRYMADNLVSKLLLPETVQKRTYAWFSLSSHLAALAEISPSFFLAALEQIIEDKVPIEKMLEESSSFPFGGGNKHVGIIWALETLAWCPDYLLQITELLMKLAILDSGGKMNPRPQGCLTSIYLPWFSQTTASVEQKLICIRRAFAISKSIALKFCVSLLPDNLMSASHNPTPKWRDWYPDDWRKHERKDCAEMSRGVLGVVEEFASSDIDLILQLLDLYSRMSTSDDYASRRMRRLVINMNLNSISDEQKKLLWGKIRTLISKYRELLSEEKEENTDIKELEDLYNRISPSDILDRFSWLFSNNPQILDMPNIHNPEWFQETQDLVERKRVAAIDECLSRVGVAGIIEMCSKVQDAASLGGALSKVHISEKDEVLFVQRTLAGGLKSPVNSNALNAGLQFLGNRIAENSDRISYYLKRKKLSAQYYKTCIALVMSQGAQSFKLIESLSMSQQNSYWAHINIYRLPFHEMRSHVVDQLLRFNEPLKAIKYFSLVLHEYRTSALSFPHHTILTMMHNAILVINNSTDFQLLRHHIEDVFKWLDTTTVDCMEIYRLEWLYFDILKDTDRKCKALFNCLSASPQSFVEVLTLVYKPDSGQVVPNQTEQQKYNARKAWTLLDEWELAPGTILEGKIGERNDGDIVFPQGTVNYDILKQWIRDALSKAEKAGWSKAAEIHIGKILSCTPISDDDFWPCTAVCSLLEEFGSDEILDNMRCGVMSRRGAMWRGQGGTQERKLIDKFTNYFERIPIQHRKARILLKDLISCCDREATIQDTEDENREFGNY